ncbi:MAG: HEAT repeat domain-containing protein [Nitrospirota bacterium]|nr:HEAT repeat domain-containing protein [Nitrospirota bacterium]
MREIISQLNDANVDVRRDAVEKIRGLKDESFIPFLLEAMGDTGWRVRKSAVDVLLADYSVEKYIDGVIRLLYIEDNAGLRNSAIEALMKLRGKATVFLLKAFETSNRGVRKFIIDVLGEQMDPRSIPLMVEAIKDEDANVRATAVEHLGKIREPSVVDALIKTIDEGDLWTAYPAADALGRIGNRKAVPHLLSALKKKPLREPVLKALGRLAEVSTLKNIIPLLEDASRNIREQALKTIETFYHNGIEAEFITGEIREILGDRALDLLISHAWSKKRNVKFSAILLLGLMKDEAAYGPLLDISDEEEFAEDVKNALVFIGKDRPGSLLRLFDTDSSRRKHFICGVAAKIGSPAFYDIFETMLDDEDGHVRSMAAVAISTLGDARSVEKIKALLKDEYEDVQDAAVKALFNLGSALKTEDLLVMLGDKNNAVRKNAALLLGKIRAGEAVEQLGFALKDDDVKIRKAVVESLSLIRTDEAVKYLKSALTDENPGIRISSALGLGAAGGKNSLDSLIILASDPENTVRGAAAKSLGILGEISAVKTLLTLLNDKNGYVVTTSIEALSLIGGDEAKDAIIGMLDSDDLEVKRTAILALASFDEVEDRLSPFLRDTDWATRLAAVRALGRGAEGKIRTELEGLLETEEDPAVRKAVEETLGV